MIPPFAPTDCREIELRGATGGGRGTPCAAVDTRRDAAAFEDASGPIDWRENALFVAPSEMRVVGFASAVERALSCDDEIGPSVVRRILVCDVKSCSVQVALG